MAENHPRHHHPRLRHAEEMNSSIPQPSTVTSGLCTRKGGPGTSSSFGVVCATATSSLPPSLSVLNHLLEGSWKQSAVKPATIYTGTPQQAHVRQAKAAQIISSRLPDMLQDTIQQCCMLFTALLAGCHVNRPFQRVCSVLKNIARASGYVTPRY